MSIARSVVSGSVNGSRIGGLAGFTQGGLAITDSYVSGSVTGTNDNSGGFVGFAQGGVDVTNSYLSGTLTLSGSATLTGAIIGNVASSSLTATNVFTTNGPSAAVGSGSAGATTLVNEFLNITESTFYLQTHPVYTGALPWDFTAVWNTPSGALPTLK